MLIFSRNFRSVDSIKNYIADVETMHLIIGYPVEQIDSFVLNLPLKGIARRIRHCVKKPYQLLQRFYFLLERFLICQIR